jgi:hypothetical protein
MDPRNISPEQQAKIDAISREPIALMPVSSSEIAKIGHDARTNTLAIEFNPRTERKETQGPVYHYGNVDEAFFASFKSAESKGKFFHLNIKPHSDEFPYVKVKAAVTANDEQQAAA